MIKLRPLLRIFKFLHRHKKKFLIVLWLIVFLVINIGCYLECQQELATIDKRVIELEQLEATVIEPLIIYVDSDEDNEKEEDEIIIEEETSSVILYNCLTDDEIWLLEVVVYHEVGYFSKTYQKMIATCILNRFLSDDFPNTIYEIIFQENQFADIEEYYGIVPTEETQEAVKEVFSSEETMHDATYFYNSDYSDTSSIIWFEESGDVEFLFEYSETGYGEVEWSTRFFK